MSLKEKKLFFDVEHSIYTFFLLFPCRVVEPWAAPLLSRFRSPRAGGPGFSLAILARAIIIALSKRRLTFIFSFWAQQGVSVFPFVPVLFSNGKVA